MSDAELYLSKIEEVNNHLKNIDDSMKDMGDKIANNNEGKIRNQMRIEECEKDIEGFGRRITKEIQECKDSNKKEIEISVGKKENMLLGAIITLLVSAGMFVLGLVFK